MPDETNSVSERAGITPVNQKSQKGDIALRGCMGIDAFFKNGYDSLQQTVRRAGDATPEWLTDLHKVDLRLSRQSYSRVG